MSDAGLRNVCARDTRGRECVFTLLTAHDAFGPVTLSSAVLWWMSLKARYSVLIRTAAGESKALTSTDSKRVADIVAALNNAIIHRADCRVGAGVHLNPKRSV